MSDVVEQPDTTKAFDRHVPIDWTGAAVLVNFRAPSLPTHLKVGLGGSLVICRVAISELPDSIRMCNWFEFEMLAQKDDSVAVAFTDRVEVGEQDHGLARMAGYLDELQTALRLVRPDRVWVPIIVSQNKDPEDEFSTTYWYGRLWEAWADQAYATGIPQYELDHEDAQPLLDLLDALSRRPLGPSGLDVAIRRFNLAYERPNPEDRLIDLFIALEALFLASSDRDRLAERLASRAASYAAELATPNHPLKSELKKLYDLRSRIVHGRTSRSDLKHGVGRVEEIVRVSLRKALTDPQSLTTLQSADRLNAHERGATT